MIDLGPSEFGVVGLLHPVRVIISESVMEKYVFILKFPLE